MVYSEHIVVWHSSIIFFPTKYTPESSCDGHRNAINTAHMLRTDRVVDKQADSSKTCSLTDFHHTHGNQKQGPEHTRTESMDEEIQFNIYMGKSSNL